MITFLNALKEFFIEAYKSNQAATLLALCILIIIIGGGYIVMRRDEMHHEIEMKRVRALDVFLQGVLEKIKEPAPPSLPDVP